MNHPQEMQVFNDKTPEQTQIEVQGLSSYDRDQYDLARLGKKQVLKVCIPLFLRSSTTRNPTERGVAKLWLHVHARLLMYHYGNMGRHVDVCIDPAT